MLLYVTGFLARLLFLWTARGVILAAVLAPFLAGWAYLGYRNMSCHPMFGPASDACGALAPMAAEHAAALGRQVAPYQEVLRENTLELIILAAAVLFWAIVIEAFYRLWVRQQDGG